MLKTVNRIAPSTNGNGHAPVVAPKAVKAPAKSKEKTQVAILPIDIRRFKLRLVGRTTMVVNRFSEKAKREIADKQQHKAKGPRAKRDPDSEYLGSVYVMPGQKCKAGDKGCRYGFPAGAFKKAAVKACRYVQDLDQAYVRGTFFIVTDRLKDNNLIEIKHDDMQMREDIVRLNTIQRTPDFRYRAEFFGWSCTIVIDLDVNSLSIEQLVNLYNRAGFSIGIGEMRPEKCDAGDCGIWHVEMEELAKAPKRGKRG